ncbi:MAG: hypothetical protein ACREM3_06225 [Candidatus Rokuibacteriota bacterium]
MRIEPELDEVINGQRGILRGIELCLRHECLVAGVALIFSGIDSLAALTRPIEDANTSRSVFIKWVERFLLPESRLACSAIDFYAARCGVLHTHSPESDLQKQGSARQLIYEWRQGPQADAEIPLPPDAIVIQVEGLHQAFKVAVDRFLVAADTEAETKNRVRRHLKALLCYRPWPLLAAQVAA